MVHTGILFLVIMLLIVSRSLDELTVHIHTELCSIRIPQCHIKFKKMHFLVFIVFKYIVRNQGAIFKYCGMRLKKGRVIKY